MTMKRIFSIITITLCFCLLSVAQESYKFITDKTRQYLLAAPFNGYNGEPKSILIQSYFDKKDLSEKDFAHLNLDNITEDERYDILRGKMYASVFFNFDKNGFPTFIEFKRLAENDKLEEYQLKIERDENSLTMKRIYARKGKRTEYILVKRTNGTEIYQSDTDKRKKHHLTIKYEGDTIRHIEVSPEKQKTTTLIVYSKSGLIKDIIIQEEKKDMRHYSFSYSYGFIDQASYKRLSSSENKSLEIKDWKFMMYEGTNNMDYGTRRIWTRRDKYEGANATYSNSRPIGFDEMTIVY